MGIKELGYIERVKQELVATFKIVNIGLISFYLGLKIEKVCQKKTLKLLQPVYINKILAKYHLNLAKLCNTLMKEVDLSPSKKQKVT